MTDWTSTTKTAWKDAVVSKGFILRATATVLVLVLTLTVMGNFLLMVENRPGVALPDPFLAMFEPRDMTAVTFILIYFSLLVGIVHLLARPEALLIAMQAYTIMLLFRMLAMFSLPLEAPAKIIPLVDPFIEAATAASQSLRKDLFFSGHTSTAFLLSLVVGDRRLQKTFWIATVLTAGCVLIQHVHYTVDVVAAPFFAFASYKLALGLNRFLRRG